MHQRHELLGTLDSEELSASLRACNLSDKDQYTEDEVYRFRECRKMIEQQKKTYDEVTQLFSQKGFNQDFVPNVNPQQSEPAPHPQSQGHVSSDGDKPIKVMGFSEMRDWVSETIGVRISWKEAGELLQACGLPDQDEYNEAEAERFLEVCDNYKNQGQSINEIADAFKLGSESEATDIESNIESTATVLDQSGNAIVREAMRYKAKADATAAPSFYLQGLADEFGSPEFQQSWHNMEEMLKAKVAGKSKLRVQKMLGSRQRPILPSRSPSNALPEALEDGSTTD